MPDDFNQELTVRLQPSNQIRFTLRIIILIKAYLLTCEGGMFDIARSYVSLTASKVDSASIRRM